MKYQSALGLDVGGANLKAVHSNGVALSRPFALWRRPADLPDALRDLLRELPAADVLAVTMTGELCDCFESKRQGVEAILSAVEAVADATPVRVWQTDGRFVDAAAARRTPLRTAAANWHALATFAGRFAPSGSALLIDVGSTTTDIVPLHDGRPVPRGRTDPDRLVTRELVYTGIRRTPLCALLSSSVASEVFATTLDVYLLLGHLPEDPEDTDTADGRPATRVAAEQRLARMICADLETSTAHERRQLAERAMFLQTDILHRAMEQVSETLPQPPHTIVLSGSGERLGELALCSPFDPIAEPHAAKIVSLGREFGPQSSAAACAHALAILAVERPAI